MASTLIDLRHQGRERIVAAYLLDGDEPALVDCGPTSTLAVLLEGLAGNGLDVGDVRHLLLTHVHLDHAGAAGTLVRLNPALQVHVSDLGAPHLIDPTRLERSARRLYGDDFDPLWGELLPVPEQNVKSVADTLLGLDVFPSPGHAPHHVSYQAPDGTCYSGDVTGVRLVPTPYVAPFTPPPDVDLEAWNKTLDEFETRKPNRLCLPHFGIVEDPADHLARLREHLAVWSDRVRRGQSEEEFVAAAESTLRAESDPADAEWYRTAAPFTYSYAGLKRYCEKQANV